MKFRTFAGYRHPMALPHSQQSAFGYGGPHIPQPASQSQSQDHPSSYLQLSDVRTGSKRKRENISATTTTSSDSSVLSTPPSIYGDHDFGANAAPKRGIEPCFFDSVVGTPHDVCLDCVVDCDDADCPVSAIEQCTDQCVVVPCNGDDQNTCAGTVCEEPCNLESCDGENPCFGAFDESLQLLCCSNYHDCDATSSQINWNRELDDLLGLNGPNYTLTGCSHLPSPNTQLTNPAATANSAPELPLIQTNPSSIGGYVFPTPDHVNPTTSTLQAPTQPNTANDFVCRWLGCDLSFSSLNELVGHVNLTHLRPPSSSSPQPSKKPRLEVQDTLNNSLALSCHWDDCHLYPDASTLPGPSTGLQPEMAFDLLSSHFFHDHLGLAVPPSQALPVFESNAGQGGMGAHQQNLPGSISVSGGLVKPVDGNASTQSIDPASMANETVERTYATPEPSPPDTASLSSLANSVNTTADSPHDCSKSTHTCHWHSCGLTFPTCAALTEHLTSSHVGSGKGHYDCHWGDCQRSGKQGFSSKQKIMRHLQAHTGYRPFLCKECGCFFSEAATLAQHMRRHTQEKPFVCDFPGCGKAFAITGALTIHKRTHNGERPFRCPHCDRAFAESSNLSKHLRTHTGDRPYRCMEPGCGKAFARPDQLQRHRNVHKKKTEARAATGTVAAKDGTPDIAVTDGKSMNGGAIEVK